MAAPDISANHDPVDALLDRLDGVVRSGAGWKARCPAHDDHDPSLSIGRADSGAALLNCQVGCRTADVVAAVGLRMADLYPDRIDRPNDHWRVSGSQVVPVDRQPRRAPKRRHLGPAVASYRYVDEHGELLFTKHRYQPPEAEKTFRIQRPTGDWGIGEAPRVLYRLPEVLAAVQAGTTVWLVEGEKDADRLAALGLTATCTFDGAANAGSTPKWQSRYGDTLRGADVVIVQDRDDAGAAHAQAAFDDLAEKAASLRIVQSATTRAKDDVSDHLDAGYTLDQLEPVRDRATEAEAYRAAVAAQIASRYTPLDWHEVFAADDLTPDWLVPDVIERGCSHAIFSPSKAGKSLLTLDMVAAIATGRPRLGRPAAEPVTCVYVDIENSKADLHRRLVDMGYSPDELQQHLIYLSFPDLPPLDTREGGQHLAAIAEHYGAELIVLDTVARIVEGAENDSDTYRALYSHTLRHLKGRGVTIIRLDHAGKDPAKGQRGSSAKGDDLDTVWYLQPRAADRLVLRLDRQRSGKHPDEIQLARKLEPLRHLVMGGTEECIDPAIAAIVSEIDKLGVENSAGRDRTRKALSTAGLSASNDDLAAAIRVRKARLNRPDDLVDDDPEPLWGES